MHINQGLNIILLESKYIWTWYGKIKSYFLMQDFSDGLQIWFQGNISREWGHIFLEYLYLDISEVAFYVGMS